MKTEAISDSVNKGKHTTSHRELIVLDKGGIIIDNPGMREVGITDQSIGLEMTFDNILDYGQHCKYADCTHTVERGCAILEAVETGEIDERAFENFRKIQKERSHFETNAQVRKKKEKQMGKMIKKIVKDRKKNKF
jgi:ribosome biogenesis GTPase